MINIREVWPGEAKDFTPWLANNLDTLSAHLKIGELKWDSTEVEIPGGRKLDILATDADDRKWAIENQYDEADHDHLTRALAYAVGLECRAVIVVAESHRDEFVAVADEWNRYSEVYGPSGIRLFLAAIEAGRIGDSAPGFRFRLVAGPNEWKSETATEQRMLSEEARQEFWSGLQKVMRQKGDLYWSPTSRRVYSYVNVHRRTPFVFNFSVRTNTCRVELWWDSNDHDRNVEMFEAIAKETEAIHQALGARLEWVNDPKRRSNRIYWVPEGACGYRTPMEQRQAGYEALADAMYSFRDTLMPYIEQLV